MITRTLSQNKRRERPMESAAHRPPLWYYPQSRQLRRGSVAVSFQANRFPYPSLMCLSPPLRTSVRRPVIRELRGAHGFYHHFDECRLSLFGGADGTSVHGNEVVRVLHAFAIGTQTLRHQAKVAPELDHRGW